MQLNLRHFRARWGAGVIALVILTAADAAQIRIVTYNVAADVNGVTQVPEPDFITVLEAIGNESTFAPARQVDVLALEETTSNAITVDPIVASLNTLYGSGVYARSPYQATQNGSPSTGNGPNAMVYNSTSLQLVSSAGIGAPSTSGFPRQPVRYQFRPAGMSASYDFYVYVSHYKASTDSTSQNRRNIEAQAIRADASFLPASARIIYTGDFNIYTSSEAAFQTLIAESPSPGQAFDPLGRSGNWNNNSVFQDIMTYSTSDLHVRFDFQLVTQNVLNDAHGLKYLPGSYHTFGVNGTNYQTSANAASNTALGGLPNRIAVLNALVTASDHYPLVADYTVPDPSNGDFDHDNDVDLLDFAHLQLCLTDAAPASACLDADLNGDNVIDSLDVSLFVNCMNGPDQPPGC